MYLSDFVTYDVLLLLAFFSLWSASTPSGSGGYEMLNLTARSGGRGPTNLTLPPSLAVGDEMLHLTAGSDGGYFVHPPGFCSLIVTKCLVQL